MIARRSNSNSRSLRFTTGVQDNSMQVANLDLVLAVGSSNYAECAGIRDPCMYQYTAHHHLTNSLALFSSYRWSMYCFRSSISVVEIANTSASKYCTPYNFFDYQLSSFVPAVY